MRVQNTRFPAVILALITLLLIFFFSNGNLLSHHVSSGIKGIKPLTPQKRLLSSHLGQALVVDLQHRHNDSPRDVNEFQNDNETKSIALCVVVKDDHLNIREWLLYHKNIGVQQIYVYDDGSVPPLGDHLEDFMQQGLVRYTYLNEERKQKLPQVAAAMEHCVRQAALRHKWIGLWDSDEFLIMRDGSPDLPTILKRYEGYGAVVVNWVMFGSSGHLTRPPAGLLQSYTRCYDVLHPNNQLVKSIVNGKYVGKLLNPHSFTYKAGRHAVNTNFTRVDGHYSWPALDDTLVIHHYFLKSRAEFEQKMARGDGYDSRKDESFWETTERDAVRNCTYAVPLGAQVYQQLQQMDRARIARMESTPAVGESSRLCA